MGYHYHRSTEFLEINRRLRQLHPEIVSRTEHTIAELGGHITRDPKTDLLTLNDELVISLVLARCQTAANGHQRWRIRFDPAKFDPDITVAIRLDAANTQELDYYLLPRLDLPEQEIRVSNKNSADFECFRFDDLNFFYGMATTVQRTEDSGLSNTIGQAVVFTQSSALSPQHCLVDRHPRNRHARPDQPDRDPQLPRPQHEGLRGDRRQHPRHRPQKAHHRARTPG